jgi:DNA polymerase-1
LEEWLALARKDKEGNVRIFGHFNPIGAWTHRLSHAKPNLANIPVADHSKDDPTPFEREINRINDTMRSVFGPRPGYRQIGTDADGLQMRVFAHYVNSKDLTEALVNGRKENGTDIHSLHKRKLGESCKGRADAKTFIYAWLLGAGIRKVAEILGCSLEDARRAVENFIESYPGLNELKKTIIPRDAAKGYFVGLDGRKVVCSSEHLMLAGYLQNGEAVIMKGACREWMSELRREGIPFELYTWPHDEWQTGVPDEDEIVREVQAIQIQAIRNQAERLNLNCPLEGSSDAGYSWLETH